MLEHDRNGILVANDDDPDPLANAMIGLADPSCLRRYAEAARLRRNDYDLPRMISETESIYRSLVT